jgi:tRNA 2-thiouridine synthesizing protein A
LGGIQVSDAIEFNLEVDAVGMNCPLPILRTKKALATMQSGEVLKVKATDSGAAHDFPAFAKQTGNELLSSTTEGDVLVFFLKRR